MRQTILVTGGAGFVGSHTVQALTELGHDVTVFDNLQQGHRAAVPTGVRLIQGDLRNPAALTMAFAEQRYDAVLHFAANSLVGESMRKPFVYLEDNVTAGLNLMKAAAEHGVRKFVLSSTANLFGTPDCVPIPETARIDPGSPYGESKGYLERVLRWLDTTHGMRSACLRYFNAAGAHPDGKLGEDHDPETHLIPIVLDTALGLRDRIEVFGDDYPTPDGTCIRDYVHVCDLADAHVLALSAIEDRSVTYNLGNGRGYSVKEVIDTATKITGRQIPVRIGARRAGDPAILVASSERIRSELGWTPRFPDLTSMIQTAWNWRKANPSGYPKG